jgi:prepilin-type processing-associated H-X9-DG protein
MGITPIIARDSFRYSTWLTHLLPFIEQDPLWNETIHAYGVQPRNPFSDAHVGMRTVVKLFTCPSDSRLVRPDATHGQVYAALTSYQGVSGTAYLHADGVYYNDSLTELTDITDGTSNTLAFGERPPSADFYYGWWYASGLYGKQGGTAVLGVRELRAPNYLFTPGCQEGPYSFSPGNISNQCDLFHFWSLHDGGANFAFSDGAVRFMRYAADSVMPALATRAGGDVVASLN